MAAHPFVDFLLEEVPEEEVEEAVGADAEVHGPPALVERQGALVAHNLQETVGQTAVQQPAPRTVNTWGGDVFL